MHKNNLDPMQQHFVAAAQGARAERVDGLPGHFDKQGAFICLIGIQYPD
jgi:hypothetical protein